MNQIDVDVFSFPLVFNTLDSTVFVTMAKHEETKREKAVGDKIMKGEYTCVNRIVVPGVSQAYRILQDVHDNNNERLPGFYHCRACHKTIEYAVKGGSQPLLRHANACDPLPSTRKEPSENEEDSMSDDEEMFDDRKHKRSPNDAPDDQPKPKRKKNDSDLSPQHTKWCTSMNPNIFQCLWFLFINTT